MSCNSFNVILGDLRYTNEEVQYNDPFWETRHMEKFQNSNMEDKLRPEWINIMYKSMTEWFNKQSPVFMCVERKPQPFINERHKTR